jgi:hypothetical protein
MKSKSFRAINKMLDEGIHKQQSLAHASKSILISKLF